MEPYPDLELKKNIAAGKTPGPKINATGPYLEGEGLPLVQVHALTGPDDARRTVDYWAAEGAGSYKVYNFITRAELAAVVGAPHKPCIKRTGHLFSLRVPEAGGLGNDH